MQNPQNQEETFFNLRTLTLRRPAEFPPVPPTNEPSLANTTRESIITPTPSQTRALWLLSGLRQNWVLVLCSSALVLNLILVAVLYNLNYSRIQQLHTSSTSASSIQHHHIADEGPSLRKIFLTLASQQSEINSLRQTVKENSKKLQETKASLTSAIHDKDSLFNSLVRESNITFCLTEVAPEVAPRAGQLVAPVTGVYRVEFSARVRGDTYVNRKMFQIKKNNQLLQEGGTIRIRLNGRQNKTVDCNPQSKSSKSCYAMSEILLVQLNAADILQISNIFMESGGSVYGFRFCMRLSDFEEVPGGGDSLVVTH